MGNFTCCFNPTHQSAKLIDGHGNLRKIKVPITAAEVMIMEQPGYLISPVVGDLRSCFRLTALRADEALTNGKLYFLIPVGRLNSYVTETELEMLRLGCGKGKRVRRCRNAKVLPEEKSGGCSVEGGGGEGLQGGFTSHRVCGSPMWKPVLEPIYE